MDKILLINFNPEIWGHISDWCMVMVTIVTAFFLYKTLRSQKEVQHTQNELFKIESVRFRESIKPIFKYSASTDKVFQSEKNRKILTVEVINESSNIALEISKIVTTESRQLVPGIYEPRNFLKKGDNPLFYHFEVSDDYVSRYVMFALTYKDLAGTKYKQGVLCICDDNRIELYPFLPEVV